MSTTFTEYTDITYSTLVCGCCGVPFAMTKAMYDKAYQTGSTFYCPNGHSISYSESQNKQLRRELESSQAETRNAKCEAIRERNLKEQAERKLLRTKRGVCACCNRSFQNLGRHMKTKHPDFMEKK